MNVSIKQTHRHREQTGGCRAGQGSMGEGWIGSLELVDVRCKLLHMEWINKVLLYNIRNCIQYPVIKHNGKV